jgi:hypothetical protein
MKVIFLDVDGVLNSEHWYKKNHKKHPERCRVETAIDPRYVRNLSKIVKKTGAKVVLSATCRMSVKANKSHYLRQILNKYGIEIYDYTPHTGMDRGIDIQEWLNHHLDVTNIVILDDDSDMCHLMEYLVKTKISPTFRIGETWHRIKLPFWWYFYEGLSNKKVRKAIRMLKKPFINKMEKQITGNVRKLF